MGGLECAKEIRKRGFDIPVCAVTANARDAQLQQVGSTLNSTDRLGLTMCPRIRSWILA